MAYYVYERILESSQEYSMLHAGYYALRHLRIEKFFIYWGQDIDAVCGRAAAKKTLANARARRRVADGDADRMWAFVSSRFQVSL